VKTEVAREISDHHHVVRTPSTSRARADERPRACGRRASDAHASNALRDALTAVRGALGRRSQLCRHGEHLADGTATVVPQRGPRGGRKLRSGVDRRTVEAPESARGDNAPRDRIALGGGAAVSAAHLHAHLDELDTGSPKIIAVRLAQLAQCIYVVWRQSSGEAGAIPASCLCKCQIGSAHAGRPPRPGVAVSDSW
jgi:hypothetical protein